MTRPEGSPNWHFQLLSSGVSRSSRWGRRDFPSFFSVLQKTRYDPGSAKTKPSGRFILVIYWRDLSGHVRDEKERVRLHRAATVTASAVGFAVPARV